MNKTKPGTGKLVNLNGNRIVSGKEPRTKEQQEEIDRIKAQLGERDRMINQIGFLTSLLFLSLKGRTDAENKYKFLKCDLAAIPPDVGLSFSGQDQMENDTLTVEVVKIKQQG